MNKHQNDVSAPNGILLLDKHQGVTSNTVLQKVKRLFCAKKAGHMGTLDPLATGMLPICFGEATKFSHYGLEADKCYRVQALLGIKTTTGDALGDIVFQSEPNVSFSMLHAVLADFLGPIQQVPSMFSALKRNGVPLYRLARQGIEVERASRDVCIHELRLDAYEQDTFTLTVVCSKGTYIRNLVEDIGERLGVGAHVTALHRVYTAGFSDLNMYTVDSFSAMSEEERLAIVLPVDYPLRHLPDIMLDANQVQALRHGKLISRPDLAPMEYRVYHDNVFIGLVEQTQDGMLRVRRLLSHSGL